MQRLPIDPRGFPVPWFTPWSEEEKRWRFDAAEIYNVGVALRDKRCWICGGGLHKNGAFVIGPMCAVNRTTSEPASHSECAGFAVRACPFLVKPRMRRTPMEDKRPPAGIMLERNPGVSLLWVTQRWQPWKPTGGGILIHLGEPIRVEAWAEGRTATAEETLASVVSGLPSLFALAEGEEEYAELKERTLMAWKLLRLPGKPPMPPLRPALADA
jgi:hypothetical protein